MSTVAELKEAQQNLWHKEIAPEITHHNHFDREKIERYFKYFDEIAEAEKNG